MVGHLVPLHTEDIYVPARHGAMGMLRAPECYTGVSSTRIRAGPGCGDGAIELSPGDSA